MKKEFVTYLLTKSDKYLRVVNYLYSISDENNNVTFTYIEIVLKFLISKQTLIRIINDICSWNGDGTEMERRWNDNELTISILGICRGTDMERTRNELGTITEHKTPTVEANQLIGFPKPKIIHPMQKYIKDECKNIQKIKEQLSHSQCDYLIAKYPKELIKKKLKALDNRAGAERDYVSVYNTIVDWCDRDLELNKEKTDIPPKLPPKKYYTGYDCE